MNENTRKYFGWGILAFASITLLIIPWFIVQFALTKYQEYKDKKNQTEIAKVMSMFYFEECPKKEIFTYNDGELAAQERVKIFDHMIENEDKPPSLLEHFYNKAIGRNIETPAQKMLREAYQTRTTPSQKITDIYNLLKNAVGRAIFEAAHAAVETFRKKGPSNINCDSVSKLSSLKGTRKRKKSDPNELRKKVFKQSLEEINAEVLRKTYNHIKDKWRQEETGMNVNKRKTLKV